MSERRTWRKAVTSVVFRAAWYRFRATVPATMGRVYRRGRPDRSPRRCRPAVLGASLAVGAALALGTTWRPPSAAAVAGPAIAPEDAGPLRPPAGRHRRLAVECRGAIGTIITFPGHRPGARPVERLRRGDPRRPGDEHPSLDVDLIGVATLVLANVVAQLPTRPGHPNRCSCERDRTRRTPVSAGGEVGSSGVGRCHGPMSGPPRAPPARRRGPGAR